MNKITNATPAPALVDAYIKEIAKAYGVHWAVADELDVQESNGADSKVGSAHA
jgi:vacuolar protein sorting-associated protein IST1